MWRNTKNYRVWRAGVIRKHPRCVVCGSMHRRQAHHLNNGSHHPDERFDIDNGVTLCQKCHSKFHNDFIGSYKKKCTKNDWKNFVDLTIYLKSLDNVVL